MADSTRVANQIAAFALVHYYNSTNKCKYHPTSGLMQILHFN